MHGVINFLKPPGMTSHDAVQMARRATGIKRIGHGGTLDPAAAGILPLCVGVATRLSEYLLTHPKEYIAECTFGYETDTLDAVGKTITRQPGFAPTRQAILDALPHFTGTQQQIPPLYSALKKDGEKLYELARRGQSPVPAPRTVRIDQLDLLDFSSTAPAQMRLRIRCGSGTYIRSLVRDIAHHLGGCATMTFLLRTRSGDFSLEEAHTAEEVQEDPARCLTPLPKVLSACFDEVIEDDVAAAQLAQGKRVNRDWCNPRVAVFSSAANLAIIAGKTSDAAVYQPEKVLHLD